MRRLAPLCLAIASLMLLTSCSLVGTFLSGGPDMTQLVREKMARIVDALNTQDAAALRGMFTDYALNEYSTDIDEGVTRLLTLFPDGDVIWRDDAHLAGETGSREPGKKSRLTGASYEVTSGGKEFTLSFSLFTENTIDPDNVGIYQLGAVPHTASEDSGLEMAFTAWPRAESSAAIAAGPPGVFFGDSGGLSRDRAAQIVDALNAGDASTLKEMFTANALAGHSEDIDDGLGYLLSLFPDGDIDWQEGQGGSGVYERVDGEKSTVLLSSFYTLSSHGVDYRLFFADYTENTIDPDQVGIYAIGVVPAAECRQCEPEADLYRWATWFNPDATGHPGIFIPAERIADARMEQIASAVNSHDASALKDMFSPKALAQTTEISTGLDYFLSFFPNGGITWTRDTGDTFPVSSYSRVETGNLSEGIRANYKVSVGGKDYRLFFSDVTADEIENDNSAGLNRLGVEPWVEEPATGCSELFSDSWSCSIIVDENSDKGENGYPVIYIPQQG